MTHKNGDKPQVRRDWRQEIIDMGYKYPLKAPRHNTNVQYHERYQRKLFRQHERMVDKKIQQDGRSDTFKFRVARVKIDNEKDWTYQVIAPEAKQKEMFYGGTRPPNYWKSYEKHGTPRIHLSGPDGFELVLRIDEDDGLDEPLSTEREMIPEHVWEAVEKRAKRTRFHLNTTYHPPIYGPSETGLELAMKLQAEYGLDADNLHVPEEDAA